MQSKQSYDTSRERCWNCTRHMTLPFSSRSRDAELPISIDAMLCESDKSQLIARPSFAMCAHSTVRRASCAWSTAAQTLNASLIIRSSKPNRRLRTPVRSVHKEWCRFACRATSRICIRLRAAQAPIHLAAMKDYCSFRMQSHHHNIRSASKCLSIFHPLKPPAHNRRPSHMFR